MRYLTSLTGKLTLLVALPLLALLVVAGVGVHRSSRAVARERATARAVDVALAGAALAHQLVAEGELSAAAVASDGRGASQQLSNQRQKTDKTATAFEVAVDRSGGAVRLRVAAALDGVNQLADLRRRVDRGRGPSDDVREAYAAIVGPAMATGRTLGETAPAAVVRRLESHLALSRAIQAMVREQSLVEGMLQSGVVDPGAYLALVEIGAVQAQWLDRFEETAPLEDLERFHEAQAMPTSDTLTRLRDRALAAGPGGQPDGNPRTWSEAATRRIDALQVVASGTASELADAAADAASVAASHRTTALLWVGAALGLAAGVLVALRRLAVGPMRKLGRASHPATETLPRAVERAETRREATRAVYLHFGRRTQDLVAQQLRHIDSLEARADNPDALADLFLLDHMATRLRRNAESMVVLAGAATPRPWARPVSVANLVRAAAAEAADYSRVDMVPMVPAMVAGACANDLSHLVAELIDTALDADPDGGRVTITGRSVGGRGYLIAVSDVARGLSPDQLAAANALIARPPLAGPRRAEHFGLFVAGQIARRYDIPVRLAQSSGTAIAAEILVTARLLVADPPSSVPSSHPPTGPALSTTVPRDR